MKTVKARRAIFGVKDENAPTYLIVFPSNDVWEMNEEATQPNGVCIYVGNNGHYYNATATKILFMNLPRSIRTQCVSLCIKNKELMRSPLLTENQKYRRFARWAEAHDFDYDIYDESDDHDKTLICADWNNHENLIDFFEKIIDWEIDWIDEYIYCNGCGGRGVRTSPTHYGWMPTYVELSCEGVWCEKCAKEDFNIVIEDYKNNPKMLLFRNYIDKLKEVGFTCFTEENANEWCTRYQTGFYVGMNDDPHKVAKWLEENLPNHDFVFVAPSAGQFGINWNVFTRPKTKEE